MIRLSLIAITTLAVAGCASVDRLGNASGAQRLAVACEAWAGALDSLATLRAEGALSESQIERVDAIRGPVTRTCSLDAPTTAADIGRVQRAAAELAEIEEEAQ